MVEKMRKANLGKTLSDETKQKIRQRHLGRTVSSETILKLKGKTKGIKHYKAIKINVFDYRTKKCVMHNVTASDWARKYNNGNGGSRLIKTIYRDLTRPHNGKDNSKKYNPHHFKSFYAQHYDFFELD